MTPGAERISCKSTPKPRGVAPVVQQPTFQLKADTAELQQQKVNLLNLNLSF